MARTALEIANMRYEPGDQMEFDLQIRIARNQLGNTRFEELAAEGCIVDKEQAVEYALDLAKSVARKSE